MKKIIPVLSCLFCLILAPSVALADFVDNTVCYAGNSNDDVDSFNSFRRKIHYFNRWSYRMCTEEIRFLPDQDFYILASDTYFLTQTADGDFNNDGNNLVITGKDSEVVIDGTELEKDQCVIDVSIDNVVITNLTIRVWDRDYAICDHGSGNDFSGVTIVETKPFYLRVPLSIYPYPKIISKR